MHIYFLIFACFYTRANLKMLFFFSKTRPSRIFRAVDCSPFEQLFCYTYFIQLFSYLGSWIVISFVGVFIVFSMKSSISIRRASIRDIPDLSLMSGRKRFTSGSDVGIARTEQAQAEEEFKNLKIEMGNQSKYYEINSNIPIFVFIYIC